MYVCEHYFYYVLTAQTLLGVIIVFKLLGNTLITEPREFKEKLYNFKFSLLKSKSLIKL